MIFTGVQTAVAIVMLSRTELLYHQQASTSDPVPEGPNPRNAQSMSGPLVSGLPADLVSYLTSRFIGGILSIPSSSMEGAPDLFFLGDEQVSAAALAPAATPAPQIPLPDPPQSSQKHCPPSALEGANVDDALRLPSLSPQSIISAPTPRTAMSRQDTIDTFIHTLYQELPRSPKYA